MGALASMFGGGMKPSSAQRGATAQQGMALGEQRELDDKKAKLKKGRAQLALIKSKQAGGGGMGTEELMTGRGKLLGN